MNYSFLTLIFCDHGWLPAVYCPSMTIHTPARWQGVGDGLPGDAAVFAGEYSQLTTGIEPRTVGWVDSNTPTGNDNKAVTPVPVAAAQVVPPSVVYTLFSP